MISIIIPIYNQEKYLRKCLDSLAAQTYPDLDILLVDDGSTDASPAICLEFQQKDPRFRYIRQPNGGVAVTRNTGIANIEGEWVGFVDPDDWTEPEMFAYLLDTAQRYQADAVCCGFQEADSENDPIDAAPVTEEAVTGCAGTEILLEENRIHSHLWNKLFRAELFDGICFEPGRIYEDYLVLHRVFLKARKIVLSDKVLYHYRQHPRSLLAVRTLQKGLDGCHAAWQRYTDLSERFPHRAAVLKKQFQYMVLSLLSDIRKAPVSELRTRGDALKTVRKQAAALKIQPQTWLEALFYRCYPVFFLVTIARGVIR